MTSTWPCPQGQDPSLPGTECSQMAFNDPGPAHTVLGIMRLIAHLVIPTLPSLRAQLQLLLIPHLLRCHVGLCARCWLPGGPQSLIPRECHVLPEPLLPSLPQSSFSQSHMPIDGTHFHLGNPLESPLLPSPIPNYQHVSIVGTTRFPSLPITVLVQATNGSIQVNF